MESVEPKITPVVLGFISECRVVDRLQIQLHQGIIVRTPSTSQTGSEMIDQNKEEEELEGHAEHEN